jgi:superfamily I DNA/RNA helicase
LLVELPTLSAEATRIAEVLLDEHRSGTRWSEMAVLYRHRDVMAQITDTLRREGIPFECPQLTKRFVPSADSVKVVTMHSSKGLEFPLVCIPAIGAPPKNESTEEEARLLYVAMTRATRQLVMTHGSDSQFSSRLRDALNALS